jgi:hypothetical protein
MNWQKIALAMAVIAFIQNCVVLPTYRYRARAAGKEQ